MSENKTNISAGTVARTIVLALALVNQLLTAAGYPVLPIEDEQVNTLVSTIWTVVASMWAWWKTNGITKEGIEGENYIKELKSQKKNGNN